MENVPHWNLLRDMDPKCYDEFETLRDYVWERGTLPRKTKELLMLAMCCAIRFTPGTQSHAQRALANGATKGEIFEVLELALLAGGASAYREAATALQEML